MSDQSTGWKQNGPFYVFPRPVPIPDAGSQDTPLVSLCVNADWVPYIIGAMKLLARPETWIGADTDVQNAVIEATQILDAWSEGCVAVEEFRQQDNCLLQRSVDGGDTWTTIFDASTCVHALVPSSNEPVAGVTGAPQQCTDYILTVTADNMTVLPVRVNEGDTIEITAHSDNLWTDDWIGYFAALNNAYCIDGTAANPIDGICGAAEAHHSGDVSSSANHMELLLSINGTVYRPLSGTVTVPSGVINAEAIFLVNDGDFGNNFGTNQITVSHCALQWEHTFDFSLGDELGWSNGRHMPWDGTGWLCDANNVDCNVDSPSMATGIVKYFEHFYDPALQSGTNAEHCAYVVGNGCFSTENFGSGSDFNEDVSTNTTHHDGVSAYTHNRTDAAETPKHKLVKVILKGIGPDPF